MVDPGGPGPRGSARSTAPMPGHDGPHFADSKPRMFSDTVTGGLVGERCTTEPRWTDTHVLLIPVQTPGPIPSTKQIPNK